MRREMAEQPEVLARLLSRRVPVEAGDVAGVVIVARGSSDHAAVYGRYLLELATRRPVALGRAVAVHPLRRADRRRAAWLVVGVSQSGKTPEIVDVVERLRAAGGQAIAITNDADSPLAAASEAVIELGAGEERAVPATKTFTAQMAAFAVLAAALGDVPWADGELARVPDAVAAVLADPEPVEALSRALADIEELVVTARGWLYSAALEIGAEGPRGGAGDRQRLLGGRLPARPDRGRGPGRGRARHARRGPGGGRRRRGGGGAAAAPRRRARSCRRSPACRRRWRRSPRQCAVSSSRWSSRCARAWTRRAARLNKVTITRVERERARCPAGPA